MELILIVAVAKNGVIGIQNQLPWHLPEDLKHFRELTRGHAVIMGRKTWESLPEAFRPLPGRRNVVLSRQAGLQLPGAEVVDSVAAAKALLGGADKAFVIGGANVYAQAMPLADRLEITEVDLQPEGDAWFPAIDSAIWQETTRETGRGAEGTSFAFVGYRRRS